MAAAAIPAPTPTTPLATAYQRFGAALLDLDPTGVIDLAPAVIAAATSAPVETASGLALFPAIGAALPAIGGAIKAAIVSAALAASSLSGHLPAVQPTAPAQSAAVAPANPAKIGPSATGPATATAANAPDTTLLPTLTDALQAQGFLDVTLPSTQRGSDIPAFQLAEALPAPADVNSIDPVDVPEPASILVFTLAAAATFLSRRALTPALSPALSPAQTPSPSP